MKSRGVRIVKNGSRASNDIDVFDLETGEKLTDIYQVELDVSRAAATIRITSGADWVYEGEAEFVTPEEAASRCCSLHDIAEALATGLQYRRDLKAIEEIERAEGRL